MSRTFRKHPHGIEPSANPTRDGHEWDGNKRQKKFVKKHTNRSIRREQTETISKRRSSERMRMFWY